MNNISSKSEFEGVVTAVARPPLLRRILNASKWILRRYCFLGHERRFFDYFAARRSGKAQDRDSIITVQCPEDPFYFFLFGEIACALRAQMPIRVELIVLRSLRSPPNGKSLRSLFRQIARWLYANRLTDRKWTALYQSYADGVAYRSAPPLAPWTELRNWFRADRLWRSVTSKDELVAMEADGILIGDLVADSYIRWRPSPVLRLNDPYLRKVIRQALRDLHRSRAYFGKKRPALFLTSYTSYVQHGIAARMAVQLGVRVQSFGNFQEFSKTITVEDSCHSRRFDQYSEQFDQLDNREEKITAADQRLAARLGGAIDDEISFMKSSSYGTHALDIPDVSGAVIIFLHDFYDSAHAYRWMLFHDFWEWICFTIEALRERKIPFFLKPHPNQDAASAADCDRLRALYPGLDFLPAQVSNRQLVEGGMSCAVTVYGTVVSEMAYLGVPAISCADNPNIGFEIGRSARTREQYLAFLDGHAQLPRNSEAMRREACSFYFMQNLNLMEAELALRDKFVRQVFKMIEAERTDEWNAAEIIDDFRSMAASAGFAKFVGDLAAAVSSISAADPLDRSSLPSSPTLFAARN